ncbi:hypothetical protein THER5_1826 [Bifidobacterium thermacidophilum subsp. thermacidophilum]|uniref:Uncharacterized protein n=1 Tax=Bifidobacterium thermacidophilum subsp. thermacidophilum TaxID=79262 RepID=A0A087E8Z8_9BIFI|nr:hypothetical protein THER5_1826 [Bifidobacterium thermacidophilum subsp. thermacidophilum]
MFRCFSPRIHRLLACQEILFTDAVFLRVQMLQCCLRLNVIAFRRMVKQIIDGFSRTVPSTFFVTHTRFGDYNSFRHIKIGDVQEVSDGGWHEQDSTQDGDDCAESQHPNASSSTDFRLFSPSKRDQDSDGGKPNWRNAEHDASHESVNEY